jgi:hypothetical protein
MSLYSRSGGLPSISDGGVEEKECNGSLNNAAISTSNYNASKGVLEKLKESCESHVGS